MNLLWVFQQCERGATAIEYALIASLVSIGIITAIGAISSRLDNMYLTIAGAFK